MTTLINELSEATNSLLEIFGSSKLEELAQILPSPHTTGEVNL